MKLDPKKGALRLTVVLAAAFLMSLNIQTFVDTGGLIPGGVVGLTIILQRVALKFLGISIFE